ncbi:MAG: Mur ligase family protein, partial [Candidatus Eisenbacteria bacterium]|nr:Mur ligase family protein [Candidatus Eisenbacteria bacterium]
MTYADACAWLFSLERRGVRLGLDRIVGALREHGDPQLTFPSVLIGGTNGKGSTSAIVASCLQAAGRRTGLFTSPHLIDFRERIRIDGRMIPEGDVVALAGAIRPTVDRWELSFFEATTLLAFLWFRERGVDAAAVEVGLGGRLEASRPVRALVTVVTTIDLDHVKILGETRGAIAGEKAGIFRAGAPAVVSVRHSDALAVLDARARLIGIPIYERRRCLRVSDIALTPRGSRFLVQARPGQPGPREPLEIDLALAGAHQVSNAATAILALSLLPAEMGIDARAIRAGAARARWPGRAEVVRQDPLVICDVGHNPEGAESLSRLLAQLLVRRATAMRAVCLLYTSDAA